MLVDKIAEKFSILATPNSLSSRDICISYNWLSSGETDRKANYLSGDLSVCHLTTEKTNVIYGLFHLRK